MLRLFGRKYHRTPSPASPSFDRLHPATVRSVYGGTIDFGKSTRALLPKICIALTIRVSFSGNIMSKTDLSAIYRAYIACLNSQDWPRLEQFVHNEVYYNGQQIGLAGYRKLLERDFYEIPDLCFNVQLLEFHRNLSPAACDNLLTRSAVR